MTWDLQANRAGSIMKKLREFSWLLLLFFFSGTLLVVHGAGVSEEFGIKEYDDFHRVLHQLQHEALRKNDLATIRTRATELINLGQAIIKRGVPEDTKAENVAGFKQELKKFSDTLIQYGADAKNGPDDKLKTSYEAVHDSFEMLAGMLPRKAAHSGLPHRTVIYDGVATEVAMSGTDPTELWITTKDLQRATRFVIKPQGVCRDELCFPLPKDRKAKFVTKKGATTWFNLSEFARLIKQPFAEDAMNGVWYFGPRAQEQNGYLASLEAPDFNLPDLNGQPHSLKDYRGKKVLLVTWASW
jgi:hypothetical protein